MTKLKYLYNLFFGNFKKKSAGVFNLDWAVENKLITKEEMLLIKKDRAIKEYENEVKPVKRAR